MKKFEVQSVRRFVLAGLAVMSLTASLSSLQAQAEDEMFQQKQVNAAERCQTWAYQRIDAYQQQFAKDLEKGIPNAIKDYFAQKEMKVGDDQIDLRIEFKTGGIFSLRRRVIATVTVRLPDQERVFVGEYLFGASEYSGPLIPYVFSGSFHFGGPRITGELERNRLGDETGGMVCHVEGQYKQVYIDQNGKEQRPVDLYLVDQENHYSLIDLSGWQYGLHGYTWIGLRADGTVSGQ